MKTVVSIACYILYAGLAIAQPGIQNISFFRADSIAQKVKYHDNLERLAGELTGNLSEPVDKLRAIYKWIVENISYDYRFINKEKELKWPECSGNPDCKNIMERFERELAQKTAERNKGTSEGYTLLFKTLCMESGIACEMVKGSVRTKPYQLGNNAPANYFWNAAFINQQWQFVDVTMAAGITRENEETGKLMPFLKQENDVYFLTPYEYFRKDHCPEKASWQKILGISSREKFNRQPFYYDATNYIQWLTKLSPDSGIISAKTGDTLRFSFDYPFIIDRIQINTNLKQNPKIVQLNKQKKPVINMYSLKRQVYWPFEKQGNTYNLNVAVTDRSLYYIDILFKYPMDIDAVKVLRYRVNIPWTNN